MPAPSAGEVRARLAAIRAARGFVLPHHGLMAAALPELHATYEAMYRALTLDPRHLPALARETVWLAILVACDEPVGTHHVAKFRAAGGGDDAAAAVFRLAGWASGARRYAMLAGPWRSQFPALDAEGEYLRGGDALTAGSPLPQPLARLCLLAIHAARDDAWGLAAEIVAAHHAGVPDPHIAEALSLTIWPRGVNPFVRAAEVWLGLIRTGRVAASPPFRAWAEEGGQGPLGAPQ